MYNLFKLIKDNLVKMRFKIFFFYKNKFLAFTDLDTHFSLDFPLPSRLKHL